MFMMNDIRADIIFQELHFILMQNRDRYFKNIKKRNFELCVINITVTTYKYYLNFQGKY